VGVLQVRGALQFDKKGDTAHPLPLSLFLSLSAGGASSSEREEKSRSAREREGGPRARGGKVGGREEWDLTFTCERGGRDRRESSGLPGWLARYVSGMHAHRPFLSPFLSSSSRTLPRRVVFFFFSRRFCSLFDLLVPPPLGSQPFCRLVARRNSALTFSARISRAVCASVRVAG